MSLNSHGFQGVLLRLPASLRDRATSLANQESLSLNLFIASAIAEKINRLERENHLRVQHDDAPAITSAREEVLALR
jgi:hypothetical protein